MSSISSELQQPDNELNNFDGIQQVMFRRESVSMVLSFVFTFIAKVCASIAILFYYLSVRDIELDGTDPHYELDFYRKEYSLEVLFICFLVGGTQTARSLAFRARGLIRGFLMHANIYAWVIGVCYLNSMALYSINGKPMEPTEFENSNSTNSSNLYGVAPSINADLT